MDTIRKALDATLSQTEPRRFRAVISTDSLDRDGEVLVPAGMDATPYYRNPVVLWNHDTNKVIGKAVGKLKRNASSIEAETAFATRPVEHVGEWFPDTVGALVSQGVIRGMSVGFMPIETREANKGDRARYGEKVRRVYSKWQLLEYSVVSIPANQDAIIQSVTKGVITRADAKSLFDVDVPDELPAGVPTTEAKKVAVELLEPLPLPDQPRAPKRMLLILEPLFPLVGPERDIAQTIKDAIDKKRGAIYRSQ